MHGILRQVPVLLAGHVAVAARQRFRCHRQRVALQHGRGSRHGATGLGLGGDIGNHGWGHHRRLGGGFRLLLGGLAAAADGQQQADGETLGDGTKGGDGKRHGGGLGEGVTPSDETVSQNGLNHFS
ncbi:hypothetical protein D3C76_1294160 [compost metagenome]